MSRYFVTEIYSRAYVWRIEDDEWMAVEVAQCANPLDAINIAKVLSAEAAHQ